jgi:hypothetical protein
MIKYLRVDNLQLSTAKSQKHAKLEAFQLKKNHKRDRRLCVLLAANTYTGSLDIHTCSVDKLVPAPESCGCKRTAAISLFDF